MFIKFYIQILLLVFVAESRLQAPKHIKHYRLLVIRINFQSSQCFSTNMSHLHHYVRRPKRVVFCLELQANQSQRVETG